MFNQENKNFYKIKSIKGLGTLWFFDIYDKSLSKQVKEEIKNFLTYEIEVFEKKYSRFLESSDLSKLNQNREFKDADFDFLNMLHKSILFNKISENNFNIAFGGILEKQGYGKTSNENLEKNKENIKSLDEVLEIKNKDIFLKQNGVNLDLGGIGKGYLVDLLAKKLKEKFGLKYFLINAGGDIFVTSNNENEVKIALESPEDDKKYIGVVKLKNQALAASSNYKRIWKKESESKNHIISEQDSFGKSFSEKNKLASFVLAGNCTTADIVSTTILTTQNIDYLFDFIQKNNIKILRIKNGKEIINTFNIKIDE